MTDENSKIKLFDAHQVRAEWDADNEKWWFSVLDIIAILTDQADYKKVRNYWKWLKNKLVAEGSQLVSATNQLKLMAATDISLVRNPQGLEQSATVAAEGAQTAKAARLQLEKSTGKPVVSQLNAKTLGTRQLKGKKQ
ncbi:MAG: hypothetical protein ABS92_01025 [Thiobacillus sp. SCN 63-374]|nr:MAG: hypothetical protein ABS92_01025 [Thiobacillus sp. SCN 63-374]